MMSDVVNVLPAPEVAKRKESEAYLSTLLYSLDDNPDRKPFLDEFFGYRRKNGLYSKIPVIARKPLDVFVLYYIVQKYGGFEQTMKNRMWSQIARELDLPRTMTSGAFTLKLKYIRLLYQFECHKCQKSINHAILYNESALADSKELKDLKVEDERFRQNSKTNEAADERRERDYRTIQEIEYRKSINRIRNSPTEETDYQYIRQQEVVHRYESYPIERISPLSTEDIYEPNVSPRQTQHYKERPDPPRLVPRYPYFVEERENSIKRKYTDEYIEERPIPIKRKYSDEDHIRYDEDENVRQNKQIRRAKSEGSDIKQFSVDFMEIADNKVVIKVRLNNEKYEGILQSC